MLTAKRWTLVGGPALAALVALWLSKSVKLEPPACWTAAITTLCAVWWVFETIPIPATSMLPFALLPLVGVLTHAQAGAAYGDRMVLLLLGGAILSQAMEKSGAHRRLALGMVRAVGGHGGRRLVLGFMIASAALSMWISNTATTLMLLPIAMAVIEQADDDRLTVPLLLGLAYAASIGGIGTPIGTPPNLLFMREYQPYLKSIGAPPITFFGWMKLAVPVVVLMLPIVWLWTTRGMGAAKRITLPTVGPWRKPEVRVMIVFAITALAWMTRQEPFGGWSMRLSEWFNMPGAHDSTVALLASVALFIIPDGEGQRLLDWEWAKRVPWGLFILFGGGLAIAKAFEVSKLSDAIGHVLSNMALWWAPALILAVCLCVTFMTELTTNTATTALLMPILLAAGTQAGRDPALLMLPAAISASCAFMLPVATAPNAIVFGTGRFPTSRMAREGFAINLFGAVVVSVICLIALRSH